MTQTFSGETHAEHRRYPRLQINLPVRYKCLKKGNISLAEGSSIEDLGAGGMAMRSHQLIEAGELLMVTIYLPPDDKRGESFQFSALSEKDYLPVSILSRVAWSASRASDYMTGIQFLDLSPGHRKLLKSFLIDYDLDQPDSELYKSDL